MDELKEIASRPEVSSAAKLWERAKTLGLTKKEVTEFWRNRPSVQMIRGRPASTEQKKIRCWTGRIGCLQIDLMDISKYKGFNNQNTFLLNMIDVHSRYAWSFAVKNKKPAAIKPHLQRAIADYRSACRKCIVTVFSDDGSEWKADVSRYLKAEGINRIATTHKQNMAIVERFNQTLWKTLNVSYFANDKFRFVPDLQRIIDSYNSGKHSSIGVAPRSAFYNRVVTKEEVLEPEFDLTRPIPQDVLKVNDTVRRQVNRKRFDKPSASTRFSSEVYRIKAKSGNRYVLENTDTGVELRDKYLARQLSLTNARQASASNQRARNDAANRIARRQEREPAFQDRNRRAEPRRSRREQQPSANLLDSIAQARGR